MSERLWRDHKSVMQKYSRSILFLATSLAMNSSAAFAAEQPAQETIVINTDAKTKPFPHVWEHMFGSGRSILALRDDYRADLRKMKEVADIKYVRFHDIFHDDVGVYDEDKKGNAVYNFSYVDQIYDGLLAAGVRPFVELSFMPAKLAAKPAIIHSFWYRPNVTPPKSWQRWSALINAFTNHLIQRYGIEEVSKWYFEVWNEPDLEFWGGKPRQPTYYRLYDVTAREIKKINPRLRVGGPATATNDWIPSFLNHCAQNRVPLDFLSTHTYANDDDKKPMARSMVVANNMRRVNQMVAASRLPKVPVIWSEYNASWKNEVNVTDSEFMGPWLANNIAVCDGLAEGMSFWTFSDVFDEDGVVKRPFYGGFGAIAIGGIPKASYNAFKLMHLTGEQRLPLQSTCALATKRNDGSLVFAVWNYMSATQKGSPKSVKIQLKGPLSAKHARVHLLDKDNGTALTAYKKMGSPDYPTRIQQEELRKAAELPAPREIELKAIDSNHAELSLDLQPKALAVVELMD